MSRSLRASAFAFALAIAASSAVAAPDRLSDTLFLAASRCLGLMQSKPLATPDVGTFARYLKAQGWSRPAVILDQADDAREDAQRLAGHGGDEERARLIRERDGACQAYVPAASVASSTSTH